MLQVEGVAQLCFSQDGSCFHGNIITADRKQYGLMGTSSRIPEGQFHECCFDDTPQFYTIRVIDHSQLDVCADDDVVLSYVMRTGGDNCSLQSDDMLFDTDQLIVDEKADRFIEKYFSSRFIGHNCYVCVGPINISYSPR